MAFLAVVVLGCWLSGCAKYYYVKVNGYTALSAPEEIKPGGSFFVMENEKAANPLLEAEIKQKIHKLLEARGYSVTSFEKADYLLFFSYGLGEPRTVAVPEYYGGLGWGWGWGGGYWGGGPSVWVGGPPYWAWDTDSATLYDRWLQINVVNGPVYRNQALSKPVWVGEARSTGASADLRTVLNYLLVADFQEFGRNTGKAVTKKINRAAPQVEVLIK
jgi:hypothetical protein